MDANKTYKLPQKLIDEYRRSIPEKLIYIKKLIEEFQINKKEETLKSLRIEIHKLAGNAGTYGYPQVSDLCIPFDQELLNKIESLKSSPPNPNWISEFERYFERIKEGFSDVNANGK